MLPAALIKRAVPSTYAVKMKQDFNLLISLVPLLPTAAQIQRGP